jgi:hypothetical protein
MHDTEKMIEFVRAKLATLPERGVEIPVKVRRCSLKPAEPQV